MMDELMRKAGSVIKELPGEFTEGMIFPADKDQILDQARKKHLPGEVVDQLEKIPDKKYSNIGELISEAVKGGV